MTIINWAISREDHDLIMKIAYRVTREFTVHYPDDQRLLIMDLTACHTNGCALDLAGLLDANLLDLSHDVYGIRSHINRDTGKLENCFLPRYALRNRVEAQ